MKKLFLSLSVLFGLSGASMAQTVSVSDIEALPGETVTATINLAVPADSYTGFQMTVQFPAEGFSMAATGAASGWNGSLEYGAMEAGKVKFAAAASKTFETAAIAVEFTVGEGVALGEYPVAVNVTFEGAEGKADAAAEFAVDVVNRHVVILDENGTEAPANAANVDVVLNRTINVDEWSTICLPFAATSEQLKAAFGNDVQLAAFTAWESEEDEEGAITAIKVNFSTTGAAEGIEANKPMLIKVSAPVETATFEAVNIETEAEPVVQVGKKSAERGYFYGTYTVSEVPEENLFLSGGDFWYSTGATAIMGYRGYFEFKDVLEAYYSEGAEVKVSLFIDDEATGIKSISDSSLKAEEIYNLAGQRVGNLKKGINIVNGKKVLY